MNDIYKKLPADALASIAKALEPFQHSVEMAKAWQSIAAAERREQERLRKDLPRRVSEMATEATELYPEHRTLIASAREEFEACFKRVSRNPLALSMVEAALTIFAFVPPDSETKAKILKEVTSRAGKARARQKSYDEWKQWRQPALKEFKRKLRETPGIKQESLVRHIRKKVNPACVDSTVRTAISKWKRRLNRFLPLMQKRKNHLV